MDDAEHERLVAILDKLDAADVIDLIDSCRHASKVAKSYVDDAISEGDVVDKEDYDDAESKIAVLENDLRVAKQFIDGEADRLHEMICEGRRDDAIALLSEITGLRFRSVREWRNLFPERVPA